MHSSNVIKAVCVTAELCGRTFTEPAARVFCDDLAAYPEDAVMVALGRCRREVKGMLTTQDVISRLDDGRPGVEEAWAQIPTGEDDTIVWTAEMAEAHAACAPLLAEGDRIGARMCFKEVYTKAVQRAVSAGQPVEWVTSLGWDLEKRKRVLLAAVKAGKLPALAAREECPALPLTTVEKLALPAPDPVRKESVREKLAQFAQAKTTADPADPKAWARELKRRDEAGEDLTIEQRDSYKRALHYASDDSALFGPSMAIPVEAFPPGMRAERAAAYRRAEGRAIEQGDRE
ncbi:MAG: hypothetical protein EOP35_01735 [Rubrivivax sp.]|nr:MAG: hypothetical protein EOP35_01735 [Rubrivivax sp.]